MNIMFMREFGSGKPTEFARKIRASLYGVEITRRERVEMMVTGMVPVAVWPKRHTMRAKKYGGDGFVKECRVRVGMGLSFRHWEGKPYRSRQEEFGVGGCKGVQDVVIIWSKDRVRKHVVVDGVILDDFGVGMLARNDGFDSVDEFFEWFSEDFDGWIIHWTELRY